MNAADSRRSSLLKLLVGIFFLLGLLQLVQGVLEADVMHLLVAHIAFAIAFVSAALAQRENMVRVGQGLEIATVRNVRRLNPLGETAESVSAFRWTLFMVVALLFVIGGLVLYLA
jgi:hypothetical protein